MFPRNAVTLAPSMDTEAEAIQSSPRFFLVSDRVGEIEEAAGFTPKRKSKTAERKLRDCPVCLRRPQPFEPPAGTDQWPLSLMFSEIRRDKNNPLDHFCGRNTSTTKLSQEFERVKNSSKSRTSV